MDEQITEFCTDIRALSATYEALNNSLHSPVFASAAHVLEHNSGNRLWQQQANSIKDCENTMLILNDILNEFAVDLGNPYRRGYELLSDSLSSGDIVRLRQRVQLFNSVLALPLQMMTTHIQNEKRAGKSQQQAQPLAKMDSLNTTLSWLTTMLRHYSQLTETYVASNWTYQDDRSVCDNLNGFIVTVQRFLSAARATSIPGPWSASMTDNAIPGVRPRRRVTWAAPNVLTHQDSALESWIFGPDEAGLGTIDAQRRTTLLSPTATTQDLLGDESSPFQWSRNDFRDRQTSLLDLDNPFLDTPSFDNHPSYDSSLISPPSTEKDDISNQQAVETPTPSQDVVMSCFASIRRLCGSNANERAASEAIKFLKSYTSTTIPHSREIERNILHSNGLGLAGTGHGYAPLHFFVSLPKELPLEVGMLIDYGVDINATLVAPSTEEVSRPPCHTALQLAAERGHAEIAKLLAEQLSIDMEAEDSRGLTALFIAWRKGHLKVVEILISHGAVTTGSPEIWHGNSLLHGAAWLCNVGLVMQLIDHGADINAKNGVGSTPLIAAAISTDIDDPRLRRKKLANCTTVMKLLLKAGANFRIKNNEGHNAMYYAEREHNVNVVALLEGRGAKRAISEAHPLHPHDVVANAFKRILSHPAKPQVTMHHRSRTMST